MLGNILYKKQWKPTFFSCKKDTANEYSPVRKTK